MDAKSILAAREFQSQSEGQQVQVKLQLAHVTRVVEIVIALTPPLALLSLRGAEAPRSEVGAAARAQHPAGV